MKRIISLIAVLILCINLCSCSQSNADKTINAQFNDFASSLDPHLAFSRTEKTFAVNCFEGLFRLNKKGEPVNAAVESYTVSENGLVYTFKLRDDMFWSDEITKVTANDFVFGLKRSVLKETLAPEFNLISMIMNAKKIHYNNEDVNTLGAEAIDELTLKITLYKPSSDFLYSLAQPVAMPCNEAFFVSTKGKYGLGEDYILTNGPFCLSKWSNEKDNIKISRFEKYNGTFKTKPSSVNISYVEDDFEISTKLLNNYIDFGTVPAEEIQNLKSIEANVFSAYTKSYNLYISQKFSKSLREGFIQTIDFTTLNLNIPTFYKKSESIVPLSSVDRGIRYKNKYSLDVIVEQNINKSKKLFSNLDETIDAQIIYYPVTEIAVQDEVMKQFANTIAQTFQKELDIIFNTKGVTDDIIKELIKSNECSFAIVPFEATDNTALSVLKQIPSALKYNNEVYKDAIKSAETINDTNLYFENIKLAEQTIINDKVLYPLFYLPSSLGYSRGITDVIITPNGLIIDFTKTGKISES